MRNITQENFKQKYQAQIRYHGEFKDCELVKDNNEYSVIFYDTDYTIAPGQSVVFYDNDVCIGGGIVV